MNIRRLQDTDYVQIKHVWNVCFGDSGTFIDAYFRCAAQPQDGFGVFEGDTILSDLFMLDFCGKIGRAQYPAKFLAGCATMPEARKKDMMRTLVRHALLDMKGKGLSVSYLHPFLHAFYRKFGYETIAYVDRHIKIPEQTAAYGAGVGVAEDMAGTPVPEMHKGYIDYTDGFDHCFIRGARRFRAWLALLYADGGRAHFIRQGDRAAYALYYDKGTVRDVFEMVYFSEGQKQALLNAHAQNITRVNYFCPSAENHATAENEEFTMMRVIDPARLLGNHYFDEDTDFVIDIEDDFLKRDFRLRVVAGKGMTRVRETNDPADIQTDIRGFAQMITGSCFGSDETESSKLFKRKNSCFFETY